MTRLNQAGAALLDRLKAALGAGAVRPPERRHLEEPRGRLRGIAAAVLLPADTQAVARAVRICGEARVGIVPWSGGTGLVGGQIMVEGPLPVILSLERMTRLREIDPVGNLAVAEAGVILADLHAATGAVGRLFPLSLASEGTARVGGLLGANAGGVNVLRYGNARDLCLGVEAVLADGSILNGLSRVLKDNLGYDLRHLLIGSEGTLGIITAASLRLFPRPSEVATAWARVPDPAAALGLLGLLRDALGQAVSAFELIHRQGLDFLAERLPAIARPVPDATWSVLVEAADGAGAEVSRRLEAALAGGMEAGLVEDALVAASLGQRRAFWAIREAIPEANRLVGSVSSHDIALPPASIPAFLPRADAAIAALDPGLRVNCFGHLGDGNLHYNVFPAKGRDRSGYEALRPAVKAAVHDLVHGYGGSVAAEHGVGRLKTGDVLRYADPARLAAMRAIRTALDPAGILNPGAVLPAEHGGG